MFLRCQDCDYRVPEWELKEGYCTICYKRYKYFLQLEEDTSARLENAQQSGMGMGIEAHNDAQGCSVEFDDPENTPT